LDSMETTPQHLLIRCDASHWMGVGHVMRCLAIAQAWNALGNKTTFISAYMPDTLIQRIQNEGFVVVSGFVTEDQIGTPHDFSGLAKIAKQTNAAAIVIDGYRFDDQFQDQVNRLNVVTLLVDDYGQLSHYRYNLVLNQNLGANAGLYRNSSPQTECLLGTQYALLRQEFLQEIAPERSGQPTPKQILLTFGGSDPGDATSFVVKAIQTLAEPTLASTEIKIILGAAYSNSPALQQIVKLDSRFELLQNVQNMAPLYRWADLAICAGGSSNWEMSYFGLPRIVIPIAENQRPGTLAMQQSKACLACELETQQIQKCLLDLILSPDVRSRMIEASIRMVDGQGAERVTQAILRRISNRLAVDHHA